MPIAPRWRCEDGLGSPPYPISITILSFALASTEDVVTENCLLVSVPTVSAASSLATARTTPVTLVPSFETTRTPIVENRFAPVAYSYMRIWNLSVCALSVCAVIGSDTYCAKQMS